MSETIAVQERLYDATVQLTETVDLGLDLKSVMAGKAIPAEGLRLNWNFRGELKGKISGKMVGSNYSLVRGDHVTIGNIQAVLTTPEGDRIGIHADGFSNPAPQGSTVVQYRESVTFHTASPKYAWVNHVLCWATGTIDLATGKVVMKGFSA